MRLSRRTFVALASAGLLADARRTAASPHDCPSRGRARLARLGGVGTPPNAIERRWPALAKCLPRLALVRAPTPVARAGDKLWVKRDDLTGRPYGGNKVRKLAYLLADAVARDAGELVTLGGIGSHHCLATSLYGRRLGLPTTAIQVPQPITDHVRTVIRWSQATGMHAVLASNEADLLWERYRRLRVARDAGRRPYAIWTGGSTPLGTLGFLDAALELDGQIRAGACPEPAAVYIAAGSSGSLAGLLAGFALADRRTPVIGVRVVPALLANRATVLALANRTLAALRRLMPQIPERWVHWHDVRLTGAQLGPGYGHPTPAARNAAAWMHDHLGLTMETTYTGKTLAAALADRAGDARPRLYWHTLNNVSPPPLPPVSTLCPAYREFF